MSLIHFYPQLLGQNYWDVFDWPQRLIHQNFGLDLAQLDREVMTQTSGASEVINEKNKFEIRLDCNHFKPEELVVKTIGNSVVIRGKHEERDDNNEHKSWISREFSRRYTLPVGCDPKEVVSSLDSNGVLKIIAPKQEIPEVKDEEKAVPIAVTNGSDTKSVEDKASKGKPFVVYLKHLNPIRVPNTKLFLVPKLNRITYCPLRRA